MADAELKIYGDIGGGGLAQFFGVAESITLSDVSNFLDENKEAAKIVVRINSNGGSVNEGWAIYDLLKNSGKEIETIVEGKCYSIATVLMLSGHVRKINKNSQILIHNPWIDPSGKPLTASTLAELSEDLLFEENKLLDFYVAQTGATQEIISDFMVSEKPINAEKALELGFVTEIVGEKLKAFAYINKKNDNNMEDEKLEKSFNTFYDKIVAFFNKKEPEIKNQVLMTADDKELTLEKESGAPAVGDTASPDGTFLMPSGDTIIVSGGVITEITPKPAEPKESAEALKNEIESLQAQVQDLTDKLAAKDAETANFEAEKTEVQAMYKEMQGWKSKFTPEIRNTLFAPAPTVQTVAEIKAEAKAKRDKNK